MKQTPVTVSLTFSTENDLHSFLNLIENNQDCLTPTQHHTFRTLLERKRHTEQAQLCKETDLMHLNKICAHWNKLGTNLHNHSLSLNAEHPEQVIVFVELLQHCMGDLTSLEQWVNRFEIIELDPLTDIERLAVQRASESISTHIKDVPLPPYISLSDCSVSQAVLKMQKALEQKQFQLAEQLGRYACALINNETQLLAKLQRTHYNLRSNVETATHTTLKHSRTGTL